jgi:hypothetical protein
MGCNCKNDKNNMLNKQDELNNNDVAKQNDEIKSLSLIYKVMYYGVRTLGFFISLIIVPIVLVVTVVFLFKTVVLDKNVNVMNLAKTIKRWQKVRALEVKEEEEEDDDNDFEENNEFLYPVNKLKSTIG